MGKLSADKKEWLQVMSGEQAAKIISELEALPQAQTDAMMSRLVAEVNKMHKGLPPSQHPGLSYFSTAFKSRGATLSLADLQRQSAALKSRIQGQARAFKDAQDAAEAEAVRDLLELADRLDLNADNVMQLVTQYDMATVMGILRTLNGKKSKGFVSAFYGVKTSHPDIADVRDLCAKAHQKTAKIDTFWS